VVLGGGNVGLLDQLPPLCRAGSNAMALEGGFRLWQETAVEAGARLIRPDPAASQGHNR